MVYIIVANPFDSGEIVIDDNVYSTYSLAEKAKQIPWEDVIAVNVGVAYGA